MDRLEPALQLLCPVRTASIEAGRDELEDEVIEALQHLRAVGRRRFDEVGLLLWNKCCDQEFSIQSDSIEIVENQWPDSLQLIDLQKECGICCSMRVTSAHRLVPLTVCVFGVEDSPLDLSNYNAGTGFAWPCLVRRRARRGLFQEQGSILRQTERITFLDEDKEGEPAHPHLSLSAACSYPGSPAFRLAAAAFEQGEDGRLSLVGTAVSARIEVTEAANGGTEVLTPLIRLPFTFETEWALPEFQQTQRHATRLQLLQMLPTHEDERRWALRTLSFSQPQDTIFGFYRIRRLRGRTDG